MRGFPSPWRPRREPRYFNVRKTISMGLMDFIKGELIEIIEWTDDSRDTLSFRWPDNDKEIKNGAQLIVRESQVAQFVYLGQFGDTFGPGKHTLTTDNIPVLDVAARYSEVGAALLPLINPVTVAKYGIELTSFILENVSLPPEVEQAIDKRSSMAAVGNLNDFVKFQMGQGMAQPGGSSVGGFATEMAVGMAMAQQMMQQQGGVLGPQATPGVPPPLSGQTPPSPLAATQTAEWLSP